jgi:Lon protease-like protein
VAEYQEIPLFPLETVLFPGMSLPLHIFEPRYKLMIGECVEASRPFGVVFIRSGSEVGGGATIYDIGTTAFITNVEPLEQGRMNIATMGYNRFRVKEVHNRKPYLSGVVEDYPLLDTHHPNIQAMAQHVNTRLQTYLSVFAGLGKVQFEMDTLPKDPKTLAFLTAIIMRTPMQDKQTLLNVPDLLTLLRTEIRMLWRETELMKNMVTNGPKWREDSNSFSPN